MRGHLEPAQRKHDRDPAEPDRCRRQVRDLQAHLQLTAGLHGALRAGLAQREAARRERLGWRGGGGRRGRRRGMFPGVPGADGVADGQAGHQRHYPGDESGRRRPATGGPAVAGRPVPGHRHRRQTRHRPERSSTRTFSVHLHPEYAGRLKDSLQQLTLGWRDAPDQHAGSHGMLELCDAPARGRRRSRSSAPHPCAWLLRWRDALRRSLLPGLPVPRRFRPLVRRLPSPSQVPAPCRLMEARTRTRKRRTRRATALGSQPTRLWAVRVADGFALAGFPASADLLRHFLQGKGTGVDYRAGSPISQKALASGAFRTVDNEVQAAILGQLKAGRTPTSRSPPRSCPQ